MHLKHKNRIKNKMDFKIESQEAKPLVERDEITLKITKTEATPSNNQVQEAIAKLINKEKDLIIVKKVHQKFGMHEVIVLAYAYKDEKALKKFESKKKKSKKEEKKEQKEDVREEKKPEKAEVKTEEKKEGKPKEEKVEKKEGK